MSENDKKNDDKLDEMKQSALYMWKQNLLKIFTFDHNAAQHFKPNLVDAYQSFALVFIALPAEILGLYFQYNPERFNNIGFNSVALAISVGFLLSHVTYYLILSRFAELWGSWKGFLSYIQMRNLLVTAFIMIELLLLLSIKTFGLSDSLFVSITFLLGLYSIFLQWFIIRTSLQIEMLPTIGLILMDNFLHILITFGLLRIIFGTIF